ncbi:MAG: carbon-nitrogen family hydrolase [Deltaproteobacteria bacterium]|nr:carbon-nitrogen family hydrolase [Candidatus Anaeroferrophillus wilburensis]MBN2888379.1 carbon-nitrogen family hydrolase [Deltaproteobacteria bacterium]
MSTLAGRPQRLTVSLVQMNVSLGKPYRNLSQAVKLIGRDLREPTDLILLPEMWSTGYDFPHFPRLAASSEPLLARLQEIASQRQAAIGGTMLEQDGNHFYNTFLLINQNGNIAARYRKIHLFSLMDEPDYFTPGDTPVMTRIKDIPVGLITCYDLRFPELSRTLALAGSQLLLVCAQWPTNRARHWQALLRARAIENQFFVAACNRIGKGAEHQFPGLSSIHDPWGERLLQAPRKQGVFTCTLNFSRLAAVRKLINIYADRCPDAYQQEFSTGKI